MIIKWKVLENTTLVNFLKSNYVSKRLLPKIKTTIKVNNQHQILSSYIFKGDIVEFELPQETTTIQCVDGELELLYDDEYLSIINKPAKLNTIPDRYHYGIANIVQSKYSLEQKVAHIVTRLDKDTSGCVLIAKHRYIQACLSCISIQKTYIAIVEGIVDKAIKSIDLPIKRISNNQIKRQVDKTGKPAQTEFDIIVQSNDYTLVEITLKTGRTHQIRVHFSAIGHPLLGDQLYGRKSDKIDYQALHMQKLQFIHPITHQQITICAEIPQPMKKIIDSLQKIHK